MPTRNLNVFHVQTGDNVLSFTQKNVADWYFRNIPSNCSRNIEWTEDESYCAKQVSNEVQFFETSNFAKGVHSRIKTEGIQSYSLSPGKRPIVAIFIAGKGSSPSSAKLYDFNSNFSVPLTQKSFFRADRVNFHWNKIGNFFSLLI